MSSLIIKDLFTVHKAIIPLNQKNRNIYSIEGQVKVEDKGISCIVTLHDTKTRNVILKVLSDENGFYSISNLVKKQYILLAIHPHSQYNAIVQDSVTPD